MGDWIREYIEQIKNLWENLNKRAKIIIGVGILGVILALVFLIFWNGNTQYQPLFSQLTASDADAITKRLDEDNTAYRLADDGRTVMVPAGQVHKTRLEMAGEGLPTQGVVGFEIFDETKFGTTDFERRINFYRALGGELSRSIQVMDGVEFAKVQITAPDNSLFVEEERPAEASVLIKLASGYQLDEGQVMSITNLVASSVQGLSEDKVTVVDTSGNLLTANLTDEDPYNSSQLSLSQFELQRQFSERLKQDLRLLLSKVLGPDNFSLQVKAKLNFDQREVESKVYTPVVDDEGIVRSSQEERESYQGTSQGAGGVPGVTSNIPQYQEAEGDGESGNYERSNIINNYEINEKIERHVYSPGSLENLSVAVVVNESSPSEDLEKISELVQAAIGYNPDRGDTLTVTSLAFDDSLQQEVERTLAAQAASERTRMYVYAGLIAFIIIILFTLALIFRRSGKEVTEEGVVTGTALDYMVDDEVEREAAATQLTEEEKKRQQMKEEISDLILDKPEDVAQLLKSWLTDD